MYFRDKMNFKYLHLGGQGQGGVIQGQKELQVITSMRSGTRWCTLGTR